MKKFTLMIVAMLCMVSFNTWANDAATAPDEDSNFEVSHPFKKEGTAHWTVEPSGFYFGMGVSHNWDAINNSFEIGMLNVLGLNYNSFHGQNLSLGVGIHHRSYSMKRPGMLVREENGSVVSLSQYPSNNIDAIKDRSSNLNMWTVQVPLMFRQTIVKKLEIGVAGILNWNTYARVDNNYEINKIEHDTHYKNLKQEKVNFDFMGTLTWNGTGIYCRYSPGKFFKEGFGPEIKKTWTIGLTLAL